MGSQPDLKNIMENQIEKMFHPFIPLLTLTKMTTLIHGNYLTTAII